MSLLQHPHQAYKHSSRAENLSRSGKRDRGPELVEFGSGAGSTSANMVSPALKNGWGLPINLIVKVKQTTTEVVCLESHNTVTIMISNRHFLMICLFKKFLCNF